MKLVQSQRREAPDIVVDFELTDHTRVFRDRSHAGQMLASILGEYRGSDAWILAIPAGGVPVAAPLSKLLELPVDLAVVSKVTLPWTREAGYGAVAFDGSVEMDEILVERLGLEEYELRYAIEKTKAKVEVRVRELRGERGYGHLEGRTVILVDDGLASGLTMLAGISALRRVGARSVVAAVPTASKSSAARIAASADRLFCANLRRGFPFAVADAYLRWSDVSMEELRRVVSELAKSTEPAPAPRRKARQGGTNMAVTKQISRAEWKTYFDRFSNRYLRDDRPEATRIELLSSELGDQVEVDGVRLLGISFDPTDEVLEVLVENVDHLVFKPREIWVIEERDGFLSNVRIVREGGGEELLTFRRSGLPASRA